MKKYNLYPLLNNVEEMFIGPFGSSLKNDSFVSHNDAYCVVYEQKHAIQKTMDVETRYVDKDKYEELKRFNIQGGDIIVSCRGTIGETFVIPDDAPLGIMHPSIMKIRLKRDVYDKEYFNLLLSNYLKKHEAEAKGTGIKMAISAKELGKTLFPVPSMKEQHEIFIKIFKLDILISKRKQQLSKLDELVKARFVELFGDFDLSHAQNDWKTISEIGKVVGGATPKTNIEEYWDGEYRWITPAELDADGGYIYDSVRKLTKAGVDSCSLQEMPVDTVILSSRAPIGKVAIAGNTFYCNQGFKNIICNESIMPRYLYTILLLNTEYLNSLGRGATFKEISKSIVENIKIPVPSIELQNKFATFVEQTDKSKLEIQKGLEKLELLKKALMQKYFG